METEILRRHYAALKVADATQYLRWCERNGVRAAGKKSDAERAREVRLAREREVREVLSAARRLDRRPREVLTAILAASAPEELLRRRELGLIHRLARAQGAGEAYRRLLFVAQERTRLLSDEPVVGRLGVDAGGWNTFPGGLLALAQQASSWCRAPEDWKPSSHQPLRQFRSLALHLLGDWEPPAFLTAAFFQAMPLTRKAGIALYRHVAQGGNLRTSSALPIVLTRRMAHAAHTSVPDGCSVEEGLRWAQALGLGATPRLAAALVATPLGVALGDDVFWSDLVRLVAESPLLDPAQVGPLIDYLVWERTAPPGDGDRLPVGFTMKGRTLSALLRRSDAWHARLLKERRTAAERWGPIGIGGLATEERVGGRTWWWRATELLTSKDLWAEGRAMAHCVGTYAPSCARGQISIWSVTVQGPGLIEQTRVMTIAINAGRVVTEARGRRNALPSVERPTGVLRLGDDEIERLLRARRIVQEWAAAERLSLPAYLR
jgi:hypothetical protein